MSATTITGVTLNGQPVTEDFGVTEAQRFADEFDIDPYCFICGRCTDHVGEHDDEVEAGIARYEFGGVVAWTPAMQGSSWAEHRTLVGEFRQFRSFVWAIIEALHPDWYKA